MATLSIPGSLTLEAVMRLSGALWQTEDVIELRVPNDISTRSLLAYPACMQAVITWGQRPGPRPLKTNFPSDKEAITRLLMRNEIVLLACIYATNISNNTGEDITLLVHRLLNTVVKVKGEFPQKSEGRSVGSSRSVIAVDHVPDFSAPPELYRRVTRDGRQQALIDEQTSSQYVHENLSSTALERLQDVKLPLGLKVLQMSQLSSKNLGHNVETGNNLGRILFELVQNTHSHARNRVDGRRLERSVRLVHVRSTRETRQSLLTANPDDQELTDYLRKLPLDLPVGHRSSNHEMRNSDDTLRFVVVSVLDSGPGIGPTEAWAAGERSPSLSPNVEKEHLLRALQKETAGMARPLRGIGLRRVQRLLTEVGGYARLQSGYSQLTRNFVSSDFQENQNQSHVWTHSALGANNLHNQGEFRTSGTLVSMVIPVYRLGGRKSG